MSRQGAGVGSAAAAADAPAAATGPTSRGLDRWLAFALAQQARAAPHPEPDALDAGGPAAAWRLRLSHLEALPLFAASNRACELRLGASLFDEHAGRFLGHTARSAPVPYDMRRSKGRRGFHVDLSWSLFLHTRAALGGAGGASHGAVAVAGGASHGPGAPARLLAVVELSLLERSEEGVLLSEVSAGWCAVPLSPDAGGAAAEPAPHTAAASASPPASRAKPPAPGVVADHQRARRPGLLVSCLGGCAGAPATSSPEACPPSPLRAGCLAARLGAGGALSEPLFLGSPRYLLVRREAPAGCPPPARLLSDAGAECRLCYSLEPCPEAAAWAPLAPLDCLLSSRDVVPGVQRVAAGRPTLRLLEADSQLAPPRLAPVHAVVLSGLRLRLPEGFCEAVRQHATGQWLAAHGAAAAVCPGSPTPPGVATCGAGLALPASPGRPRLLPLRELQRRLCLRVSVHNGRRSVGPPALCSVATLEPVAGQRGQHELAAACDAQLAWLPADRCVALVLELLLADPSAGVGSGATETVLAWAAADPFRWVQAGDGGLQAAVAEGPAQADLRSGPGRWLRPTPLLDWRRLIERANRTSPEPPRASFQLAAAPGQAVWPPPAAPVPLQAAPLRPEPAPSLQASQLRAQALAPSMAVSEAETLVSVRAPKAAAALAALPSRKALPAVEEVQAWRIHAAYTAQAPAPAEWMPPQRPAPVNTQLQKAAGPPSGEEAAALHAGSPTAKRSLWVASAPEAASGSAPWPAAAAAEAAVTALPAASVAERAVSVAAELADPLATAEASLQLLGFEAAGPDRDSAGDGDGGDVAATLPSRLHLTWRCLGSGAPCVTPPLLPQPVGSSAGSRGSQLHALVQDRAGGAGESGSAAALAPPESLRLLDVAALERGAAELAAQGAPPAAAASLARQHRLRAARHLERAQLQLDVWDSDSLLPLGALRLPLRGLLRQGQATAELVLRVPVEDAAAAVQPLAGHSDGSSTPAAAPCSSPLRGSFLLRLACAGCQLPLPATADAGSCGGSASSWPSSPVRRNDGSQAATVVRARPALEDAGGPLLRELARQEGVPDGTAGERLPGEVVARAAAKVQRLLALQGALGGGGGGRSGGSEAGAAAVEQLVERRLLGEMEAARERCKRDAILARLQAELPACVALCVAPGEVAAFECSFANSGSEVATFVLDACGGGELCLVGSAKEWRALAPVASLAGLAAPAAGSGQRAATSPRFQLGPRETCLLRFRLRSSLAGQPAGCSSGGCAEAAVLTWQEVCVRRQGGSGPPAATFRVAVQHLAAPAVDRSLRLYWPAGSAEGAGSSSSISPPPARFAVDLGCLPGSCALLEACQRSGDSSAASLALSCSSAGVRAVLQPELRRVLLACSPPPAAGQTLSFLLVAHDSEGGAPLELWEVFVHGLASLRLSAPVGSSAEASCALLHLSCSAAGASLACHWRHAGTGAGELQARVRPGGEHGDGQLDLRFSPAAAGQHNVLLSVAEHSRLAGRGQHGRQAALLLLQLDSVAPRARRSFEVAVPAGQAVSKKVRYTRPYRSPAAQARRFRVRSLAPAGGGLLRVGASAATGFHLAPGAAAPLKLTFDAAGQRGGGRHEVLAAVESAPADGGDGGGSWRVEEVFSVSVLVI